MRTEITKLHQDLGVTMIYVTHDQVEAMTMADKIVVLSAGRIEQAGSPLELYHRPRNMFVAGFIGSPKMNFIKTSAQPAGAGQLAVDLPGGATVALSVPGAISGGRRPVTLGIRPEHLKIGEPGAATLDGSVRLAEYLGSETMFYLTLADGTELSVKADGLNTAKVGSAITVGVPTEACHLFDEAGEAIVNGDLMR
jgi:multiple sugar transport system ATP-binding protein